MRWVTRLPGLGEWGRVVDYRRSQIERLAEPRVRRRERAWTPPPCARLRRASIVVVATGAHWSADGLNGITRTTDPGRRGRAGPRPDARAGDGRRRAPAGPKGLSWSTTRATSRGPGIAEVLRAEGHEVRAASRASTWSRTTATRRSRACGCAGACTRSASPPTAAPRSTSIDAGRRRRRADEFGAPFDVGRRRRRAGHAAALRRRRSTASSAGRPDALAAAGVEAVLRDRRLRRAPADRRRDLRRPPAGARDRLARPVSPAALPARAPAGVNSRCQAPSRWLRRPS